MQLTEITFYNFRCFKGKHTVHFASDDGKKVTLFHAQNGSGKTTFLNAILWVFYGTTTGKFEYPDKIVNDDALKEGKTDAYVDVSFEHQGKNYILKRVHNQASGKTDLRLYVVEDGSIKPDTSVRDVETFIESVMPSKMAPYFFFDGEHAETLTGDNKKSAVGKAVRTILGCDIAEEAIEDLRNLRSKVQGELQKLATSEELKKAYNDRGDNEKIKIDSTNTEAELTNKIDLAKNQINSLSEEIARIEVAKDIDAEYAAALNDLNRSKKKWEEINKPFYQWVDNYSFALVGSKAIKVSGAVIEKHEFEARIPEQYSEPFIKSLLENKLCICGRPLKEHSDESTKVNSLLNEAAKSEHIQRFNRINGTLGKLKNLQEHSFGKLQDVIKQKHELEETIENQKVKEAKLKKQLKGIDDKEFQGISKRRDEIERNRDSLVIQRDHTKKEIGIAEQEIKILSAKIESLEKQGSVGEHLRQQVSLLNKLIDRAEFRLDEYVEDARKVFQNKVNEYLEKYARKEMTVKISTEFAISVKFAGGSTLPKSSGENQFVSIIFTAALVEFAKIRSNASGNFLQPGTVAPLFLDAPLGQLDRYYQLRIAEMLPELTDQLVLLLTDSQGNSEVLEKLSDYVGQHWIIIRHNKEDFSEGKPTDEITINGKEYTRCLYSKPHECSIFEEAG